MSTVQSSVIEQTAPINNAANSSSFRTPSEEDTSSFFSHPSLTPSTNIMNAKVVPSLENVKPTFPPSINLQELVRIKQNGEVPSKPPNAWIIYRGAAVKELHARGYNLQMTRISPLISEAWKSEPENVVSYYKDLAKEAKRLYKEMWPKRRYRNIKRLTNQSQALTGTPYAIPLRHQQQPLSQQISQTSPTSQDSSEFVTNDWFSETEWLVAENSLSSSLLLSPIDSSVDAFFNATTGSQNYTTGIDSDSELRNIFTDKTIESNDLTPSTDHLKISSQITTQIPQERWRPSNRLQYHRAMQNWHKYLQHNPYRTIADAKKVLLFNFHVV
ncbi:7780_t:CDS:1 [Ambispora leptoticha]|uniref:7780_t:CDS:1 n=1 Tax=Ambispora leptoticha TaxID=144679 RepID=A0A9N8YXF6_9GLOM|nr:7780_t:CDS:1 [Ambispora leptoticha]